MLEGFEPFCERDSLRTLVFSIDFSPGHRRESVGSPENEKLRVPPDFKGNIYV